jgi:GNAT superfamily N-acetyltransferase
MTLKIERIPDLVAPERVTGLAALLQESQSQGHRFVQRLVEDWVAGSNQFDQPGEAFFVAKQSDRLVGICGLNRDPYTAVSNIGRVRHLYVMQFDRRQGVGRALVERVIAEACFTFNWLHARTDNPIAAQFYCTLGFTSCSGQRDLTHRFKLDSIHH